MGTLWNQYQEYERFSASLRAAVSLLGWDMRGIAPKGGREERIRILGDLSGELFRRNTAPEYVKMLRDLKESAEYDTLTLPQRMTVDRRLEDYECFSRVPAEFNRELSEFRRRCEAVWAEARAKNDYAMFAPWLEKNIEMTARWMEYRAPGEDPYRAMLAKSVPDITLEELDALFAEYESGMRSLLPRIPRNEVPEAMTRDCTEEGLHRAQELVLNYIGFDLNRGALGENPHPLTSSIHRSDVRLTNHMRLNRPAAYLLSAIHEGGHGIYIQNVSADLAGTCCEELNADVHESQSRFFENILGHDPAFWQPIYPELQQLLPTLSEISAEDFVKGINRVQCSCIRTEADEVTYGLHILLRHELEKGLFSGSLRAADVREAWNAKTKELLGIEVPNDSSGILQDLHWSSVYFGYFPTYLLGTLYDGMLAEAAEKELGSLSRLLAQSRIGEIKAWLNRNVHAVGSTYSGPVLMRRITGTDLSAAPILRLWEKRYTG